MSTNKKTSKKKIRTGKPKPERAVENYENAEKIVGKLCASGKGFAFVEVVGGEDLFIPPRDLGGAMHGDIVEAVKVSHFRGNGEGKILRIVEKTDRKIVGNYSAEDGGVMPDDKRNGGFIKIFRDSTNGAKTGDKVVVEVRKSGRTPIGQVKEVLGNDGIPTEILSIIRSYNLFESFPPKVLALAKSVPQEVTESHGRTDFRDDLVITIDGADAKDLDDAVSVKRDGKDYILSVHIADVSEYVKYESGLDREAFKRGTSFYFVDRVLPMLPRELSNGICSLNESVDRLTLSVVMRFDDKAKLKDYKVSEGIIKTRHRMTYEDVQKIIDGDAELNKMYGDIAPMLMEMAGLAEKLFQKRIKRGAIEFDIPECKILVNEKTEPIAIRKYDRLQAHKVIEEFMLVANETVAQMFEEKATPFVYRVHMRPKDEKLENLLNFLEALGVENEIDSENPQPIQFAKLLENIEESKSAVVSKVTLRSMTKASYEPECKGHFGLAAKFYCHFTSPIRRYPDLAIHRIIKEYLRGGEKAVKKFTQFASDASVNSSIRERLAEEAERKVEDYMKAVYMKDKIGEKYTGTLSGINERNVFVELDDTVEGMIPIETLPKAEYSVQQDLYTLSGGGLTLRLGDKVDIVVKAVEGDRVIFGLENLQASK